MGGDTAARHNLGLKEAVEEGNTERALKHYMIAIRAGDDALKQVQQMYSSGHATKEDYTKALQLYQEYLGEIKSSQRDKAAASYENCRYY